MGEMGRLVVLQAFVSFRRQPVRAKPWLKRAGWVEMKSNVVSWTGGRCAARSAHAASAGQAPGAVGAGATSTPLSQGCAAWSGPPLPAGPIRHEAPACQCGDNTDTQLRAGASPAPARMLQTGLYLLAGNERSSEQARRSARRAASSRRHQPSRGPGWCGCQMT